MGHAGLINIASTLDSVFGNITVAQDLIQTTRVALISYDSKATLIADLTEYTNSQGLMKALFSIKPSDDAQVNILDALRKTDVVREGVNEIESRRTVIVLVASAYNGHGRNDPTPYATQIKESGVKILTIAFVRSDEGYEEVKKLSEIASPGFDFTTRTDPSTLADRILEAFCHVNCFCPNGWAHVTDDFQKPTIKYAECVRLSTVLTNWFGAWTACANEVNNKAFLASERSAGKHKFHIDYVRSINSRMPPYFIGLSWDDASRQYLWSEKFDNGDRIPLDPSVYEVWASGNGKHKHNPDAVQVVPLGFFDAYWYDVDEYGQQYQWTEKFDNGTQIPLNASVVYWASGNGNHRKTPDGVQVAASGSDTYWYDVGEYSTSGGYMCQVNACDTDNYCDDSVNDDE